MLILYYLFLKNPLLLLIPYVLQVIPYFFILKKLGHSGLCALLPPLSEYLFTRKVFPKKRTFYNPFILSYIMVGFAYYVSPYRGVGITYLIIGFIVYSLFLVRLYYRLGKAFGKKWHFILGAIFLTPVALLKLGLDKSQFTQPSFKPQKTYSRPVTIFRRIGYAALSVIMVLVIVAVAGFFSIQQRVPRFVVDVMNSDTHELTRNITDTGETVSRTDTLGNRLNDILENTQVRDRFFPDHKKDKDVTVFVYIVGSNLEDGRGLASVNIDQMIDATSEGSALKFVIEAGGSERWFTRGIKNSSYGRYEIEEGRLTRVMELPDTTNMSDARELADFLEWGKENYSTDRKMLVMWDHGDGVTSGFGKDDLNGGLAQLIPVSGIARALEVSGTRFDVIGFDACLMQDIEIAKALEPYADYYIASEESESGYGWPFTYAFASIARDPGLSTEEFARRLISCYDPYNTVTNNDVINTSSTLSLVDLPLASAAYDRLSDLFRHVTEVIANDPAVFADISIAAENTYQFGGNQIDLIDFLEILDEIDYSGRAYDKGKLSELTDLLKASVICRNGNSALGANGIAFAFGNKTLNDYVLTSKELKSLNLTDEKKAFDTYFSIMAAQQKKNPTNHELSMDDGLAGYLSGLLMDMTFEKQEWYIPGFEDYDNSDVFIDVPLTLTDKGYMIELPDHTWKIITDVQTMVYQRVTDVEGAYTRYLGNDYLGDIDDNGHNLIASDDNWVHIDGQIVCYEADQVKVTKAGEVYTGRIRARLNNLKDIYVLIEWDPCEDDAPESAHVIGYISADDQVVPDEKGNIELVPGDTIQFMFSYYDENGNYIDTLPAGKRIRISKQERLEVLDLPMEPCTIEFGGLLKDVYQRLMTTEMIEHTVSESPAE